MARPKTRIEGAPRFSIKDRVVWKSGKHWRSGEVLVIGKNQENIQGSIPTGYKLQYVKASNPPKNTRLAKIVSQKSFAYLVAADSPLFKPGFTVHSIPEHHLQKETESWFYKQELIRNKEFEHESLRELVLEVAKATHRNKKTVPENILKLYESLVPELYKGNTK